MDKDEIRFSNEVIAQNRCVVCDAKDEVIENLIEENRRLKNRNRVLMSVKSILRQKVTSLMLDSDEKFEALCSSKPWEDQADGFITD